MIRSSWAAPRRGSRRLGWVHAPMRARPASSNAGRVKLTPGGRGWSRLRSQGIVATGACSSRSRSLHVLVEAVVVQRAHHGSELFAELLGGRGDDMSVDRAAILPDLVDGEVVRPVALLPRLEAHRAGLLAAVPAGLRKHV